ATPRVSALPVSKPYASRVANLKERYDREHPVTHLLAKAVHHRQDDDQRGDAEGDACHRRRRDEGDEAIAAARPPGPRVAPADLQFVGPVHAAGIVLDAPWPGRRRALG